MSEGVDEAGIGGRVRTARHRAGLSREALAFHSGISWSAIAQVEAGRRTNVRPATLAALAQALGVTIDYLVCGRAVDGPMFDHRALFYDGEGAFVDVAAPLLLEAVERSEAALAAVDTTRVAPLRERLGARAADVEFVDHSGWRTSPIKALDGKRTFVRNALAAGAPWVTVLAEPLWRSHTEAQVRMWTRFESVLNLIFRSAPVTMVCLYDSRDLDPKLVERARATHPEIIEDGAVTSNASYSDPAAYVLQP